MSDISITFELDNKIVRDPVDLGSFSPDEESSEFDFLIKHNSNKTINDCFFFLSPYDQLYDGTSSPLENHKRLSWFADNYEGYGLSIFQEYAASGVVFQEEGLRLVDLERSEDTDIFSGSEIEILSGPIAGEKVLIDTYDTENNVFNLLSEFSIPVTGETYRIVVQKLDFIKNQNGTSAQFPIPLLYRGGKIRRFEVAKITVKLKIPPYMKSAGIAHLNFNMQYTPEE